MASNTKVLLLTLHTFSLTGGIEKVCRIFSKVLHDLALENVLYPKGLKVRSLCDNQIDVDQNYCLKENFKGYGYNRTKFGLMAVLGGVSSDIIVLSHINLLPIAFVIKLISKKKRIISFAHGIEVWRDLVPWKKRFLQNHVEIWAVSDYTACVLKQKHQINDQKIKVLNNCLDPYFPWPTHFEKPTYLLDRYQLTRDQPIMLTITRVSSHELYKGYDLIIETLPKLLADFPDLVYILAGKADAPEQLRLKQLIKDKGLENQVILANFIPNNELVDFFLLADVFVMPSKKEGFGIVFIEAAASGCRVIAGNQDGSRDALLNGELGTLINPDSSDELVAAIRQSVGSQKKNFSNLIQQQTCLSHFGYEHYQKKVAELLKV